MFLRYTSTGRTSATQRLSILTGGLAEAFTINNDGNVGMGMTSPLAKLDITTTADTLANLKANISSNGLNFNSVYDNSKYAPGITWTPTNLSTIHPAAGIWAFMGGGGSSLHFGTSNTYGGITNTAMTINYLGLVGIGTTTPTDGLVVVGPNVANVGMEFGNDTTGVRATIRSFPTIGVPAPITICESQPIQGMPVWSLSREETSALGRPVPARSWMLTAAFTAVTRCGRIASRY